MKAGATFIAAVASGHARVSTTLHRALAAGDQLVAGVLDAALSTDEKSSLGVRLYDGAPHYRDEGALHPWEQSWFSKRLPAAPARVLIGGCGAGREVVALRAQGYLVSAFEPAESLLELTRRRCPPRPDLPDVELSRATYEEWSGSVPNQTYDAVILGWGSISHVISAEHRCRVIATAHAACPEGPILLSFWRQSTSGGGTARAIGARVGRRLAGLRGVPSEPTGDAWVPNIGFAHGFDDQELASLAASAARRCEVDGQPGDYPHATFVR